MGLLAIYVSSLEKCLFKFAHFKFGWLFYCLNMKGLGIFWIQFPHKMYDLQICSLIVWVFSLSYSVL